MKNLLVYISPVHKFSEECQILVRVQIDNSLDLGVKPEDQVLVTNFPFSYNGVKAVVVGDEHWYAPRPRSIKTAMIPFMVKGGIINEGIYWQHDFDAYQMNPMTDKELDLEHFDAGLTDYGWKPRWCLGSYFFKKSAVDIFEQARNIIYQDVEDERALVNLCFNPQIALRCSRLNITYNFGMRNVEENYERADKPIRVVHFHPHYPLVPTLDIFMYGKNGLKKPIMNKRLIKIFNHHGIR